LILCQQEEAETEGKTENNEDEKEPDNVDDNLYENSNKRCNVIDNTEEVLGFPKKNHLCNDNIDS